MRAVVVYESLFGSTRDVAHAIADGLRDIDDHADIVCVRATEATPEQLTADHVRGRVGLLVVGGPTHALGISSDRTRHHWLRPEDLQAGHGREGGQLEPDADRPGLRQWLQLLPPAVPGTPAASFDTRLDRFWSGGAAGRIARQLRVRGYDLVVPPEGFFVEGIEGPLREGEWQRAREWAAHLVPQKVP